MLTKFNTCSLLFIALSILSVSAVASSVPKPEICPLQNQVKHTFETGSYWQFCWQWDENNGATLHDLIFYSHVSEKSTYIVSTMNLNQLELLANDDFNNSSVNQTHEKITSALPGNCSEGTLLSDDEGTPLLCTLTSSDHHAMRLNDKMRKKQNLDIYNLVSHNDHQFLSRFRLADDGSFSPAVALLTSDNKVDSARTINYFWRINFDIAGTGSDDFVEILESSTQQGNKKQFIHTSLTKMDNEFSDTYSRKLMKSWRIADGSLKNNFGMPISYHIFPLRHNILQRDRKRTWTKSDVFFTTHKDCEKKAMLNTQPECSESVDKMIDGDPLHDVVAWVRLTAHYDPKTAGEDAAPLWHTFTVYPRDINNRNPNVPDHNGYN